MVQKKGLSMVQLSDFQKKKFGKGAPGWYNEIVKKFFTLRYLIKILCLFIGYFSGKISFRKKGVSKLHVKFSKKKSTTGKMACTITRLPPVLLRPGFTPNLPLIIGIDHTAHTRPVRLSLLCLLSQWNILSYSSSFLVRYSFSETN